MIYYFEEPDSTLKKGLFRGAKSDKQRLEDIKEFLRLEKKCSYAIGKVTQVFD